MGHVRIPFIILLTLHDLGAGFVEKKQYFCSGYCRIQSIWFSQLSKEYQCICLHIKLTFNNDDDLCRLLSTLLKLCFFLTGRRGIILALLSSDGGFIPGFREVSSIGKALRLTYNQTKELDKLVRYLTPWINISITNPEEAATIVIICCCKFSWKCYFIFAAKLTPKLQYYFKWLLLSTDTISFPNWVKTNISWTSRLTSSQFRFFLTSQLNIYTYKMLPYVNVGMHVYVHASYICNCSFLQLPLNVEMRDKHSKVCKTAWIAVVDWF